MLVGVIAEQELLALSITPLRMFDGGPLAQTFGIPDTFYQARSTIVGFVMPGLVDETDVLLGAESVGRAYITQDYQGIFPDPLADDDTFYDFTRGFIPVLRPAMWYDADFYLRPDVGTNTRSISFFARFVDTDIIFTPSFSQGVAPALFGSDDVIRPQVIHRAGDAIILLTGVFSDADTFFEPSLAKGLRPGLVAADDAFHGSTGGSYLLPGLFAADDVFYAAFPTGQVLPGYVLDTDVFIGPELREPGRMGLFLDDDIMRSPSVSFGPLLAPLVADAEAFRTAVIGEFPPLSPNDPFIDFADTFYGPTLFFAQRLAAFTWIDVDIVYSVPGVILGQALIPTVVVDDINIFYAPTLPPTISPTLFAPADVFFTPTVIFDQSVSPDWFIDTDAFFAPSMTALAGFDGPLAISGPIMPSDPPLTIIYIEG
jgi:hypothetical protein